MTWCLSCFLQLACEMSYLTTHFQNETVKSKHSVWRLEESLRIQLLNVQTSIPFSQKKRQWQEALQTQPHAGPVPSNVLLHLQQALTHGHTPPITNFYNKTNHQVLPQSHSLLQTPYSRSICMTEATVIVSRLQEPRCHASRSSCGSGFLGSLPHDRKAMVSNTRTVNGITEETGLTFWFLYGTSMGSGDFYGNTIQRYPFAQGYFGILLP